MGNIAAVNNNPFEYWITYDENPQYVELMENVEDFILNPGERDVAVHQVFTDEMFDELAKKMEEVKWENIERVRQFWQEEFRERKIISGFLQDKLLGSKRLASMPDRVTNTINLVGGGQVYRPTPINMFEGDLSTLDAWFQQWIKFFFDTEVTIKSKKGEETKQIYDMLLPISKKKYKDITEDEEAVSIPLSTMCQGIFDAILIHMLNSIAPGVWMPIKLELGEKLNKQKLSRTLEILET